MPKLANDVASDIGSEAGDAYEESRVTADAEAKEQLNGELQDDVDEMEEDEEEEEKAAREVEADEEPEDVEEGADEDDDNASGGEDEYVVEAIRGHRIRRGIVEYEIKWLGYEDRDNTWEPEDNLLPHAAKILSQYHVDIGGTPSAKTVRKSKSRQSLRRNSTTEESPAPKRQKRNGAGAASGLEELSTWVPKQENWEPFVEKVETVEKNKNGQLTAYILFSNGKKTRVGMDKVYRHCPRPMLRFYEDHLKFN